MKRILLQAFILFIFIGSTAAQHPGKKVSGKTTTAAHRNITGILGAFADEIAIILSNTKQQQVRTIQKINFTEGILNGRKVVIAMTGIGKVNAAIVTTLMIEHYQPREIIFSGIAGGINPSLSPGDLVIARKVAHHDYGTITDTGMLYRPTKNPFTMQENPVYFNCAASLVSLAQTASRKFKPEKVSINNVSVSPQIVTGNIVTGDVFVASAPATTLLFNKLEADATEMEGAAVAQVCWQQQSPFIIIRCLSDNANSRASLDVKEFYQIAARNSAGLVMAMVALLH